MSNYILINGTLYHHGILGQKWGKRNGPPYPLKEGKHSKAEEDAKKKFHLTDKQKKYAKIGLAILGTSLAVYGGYKVSQLISMRKSIEVGSAPKKLWQISSFRKETDKVYNDKDFLDRSFDYYKDNYYKNRAFNSLDDIPKAEIDYYNELFNNENTENLFSNNNLNSDYIKTEFRKANCFNTVSSLIMRIKGYDVRSAMSSSERGFNMDTVTRLFNGTKIQTIDSNEQSGMISKLLENGNNRYGYLDIQWKKGLNRHAILYAVVNNKVLFIDGQDERTYTYDEFFSKINIDNSRFVDVTDAKPNEYILGTLIPNNNDDV